MVRERALGDNILFLMRKNNISISDMAEKIGVSTDDLKRVITSRRTLPSSVLRKIAEILNVDPISLFELDESRSCYSFVDCMEGFSKQESVDKILDIIDAYCNVKESLVS